MKKKLIKELKCEVCNATGSIFTIINLITKKQRFRCLEYLDVNVYPEEEKLFTR